MKSRSLKIAVIIFLLFFVNLLQVYTESFRVHSIVMAKFSEQTDVVSLKAGINDALYIVLPEDDCFIQGLDIEVKIPKDVAAWRDSVAYAIYENISPEPLESIIDYSGDRLCVFTFPGRLSQNIRIPFKGRMTAKESPYYNALPAIDIEKKGAVFFRLQLVMKGTSDSIENAKFDIAIKPILANEGKLRLSTIYPVLVDSNTSFMDGVQNDKSTDSSNMDIQNKNQLDKKNADSNQSINDYSKNESGSVLIENNELQSLDQKQVASELLEEDAANGIDRTKAASETNTIETQNKAGIESSSESKLLPEAAVIEKPFSLYIDETPISDYKNDIILPTGIHHLSIVSDYYRNEIRTFSIEQAQISVLQIELRDISPTVTISAPENVQVYFDGNIVDFVSNAMKISQGEHSVRFVVGDYEVIKTLQAENGKSYEVSLSVNIQILENP